MVGKTIFYRINSMLPRQSQRNFFGRSAQVFVERGKRAAQFLGQQQIGGVVGLKPIFKCFDGQ